MNDDADIEHLRDMLVKVVQELHERFNELRVEVGEYKKTVNTAIMLLSREMLEFQDQDRVARVKRQRRQDIKDIVVGVIGCFVILIGCGMISILLYFVGVRL